MTQNLEETIPFVPPIPFGNAYHEQRIDTYIETGTLPWDTYFRVRAVGIREADWMQPERRLAFSIAEDIARHAATPGTMRPDTQRLLYGERPDAVLDYEQWGNREGYTRLEPMYYRLANLTRVIRDQRAETGQTITSAAWAEHITPHELEAARCAGLARAVWRTVVRRVHPEWLARPYDFCPPAITMFGDVRDLSDRTMRRRVIGAAVISDTVISDIYDEAGRSGVRGLGPKGQESLRGLLADEHPELY